MKCKNHPALVCPICAIGASAPQWRHLVAFLKALDLLHWAMCSVLYCRIAMANKTASKVGTFCIVVSLIVALAVPMMIQSKELPDGSVQWLLE